MSASQPHAPGAAPEASATRSPSAPDLRQSSTEEQLDTTIQEDNTGRNQQEQEGEPPSEESEVEEGEQTSAPPLPDEVPPPLPDEAPSGQVEDDGWEPVWDGNAQAYYFYNRFTGVSQWENPRVPDKTTAPGTGGSGPDASSATQRQSPMVGVYNPAIHGNYDPTASYAQQYEEPTQSESNETAIDPTAAYGATGIFNRFTGRWQAASIQPENYNDENKSRRQMNAFFDVDAAANSHDGRSLRAERSAKKLSKKELKMFREKRREKKEEKRRAWLRD